MTVLNVRTARAIWLVDSRDLNPHRIDIAPLLAALAERYRFQVYPKTPEQYNEYGPEGIVFANGSFAVDGTSYAIQKTTIHGDGIVMDTAASTDFSEAVLCDALTFAADQFGLTYRPEMIHTRIYTSELVVYTEKDLGQYFAPLAGIQADLRELTGLPFEPFGLSFSIDMQASTARPAPFKFEREVGKHYSQQRYYSSAPLKTSQHEQLLRRLESLL
jgi:hypothetical protein